MKYKKILVIITTLVLLLSTTTFINDKTDVTASAGEGNGSNGNNGKLNLTYIWERTQDFCNVIYKAYDSEIDIPRGRAFGSKGGNYTVFEILKPQMNDIGLEDVHTEQLGYIEGKFGNYTIMYNVTDFKITVK